MKSIVVMASGAGTLFKALLETSVGSSIIALVTDQPQCAAVVIAESHGIPAVGVPMSDFESRQGWGAALRLSVQEFEPDYIVTAGFMRIFDADFVDAFPNRIINSHPSLLPSFPGAHAVRDALSAGATLSGTTVHIVDRGVDTGPILAQASLPVPAGISEEELHEKIKVIERELLPATVSRVLEGGFSIVEGKVIFS
jgi:phosphoribosylglycinamide formyltransferase-1